MHIHAKSCAEIRMNSAKTEYSAKAKTENSAEAETETEISAESFYGIFGWKRSRKFGRDFGRQFGGIYSQSKFGTIHL